MNGARAMKVSIEVPDQAKPVMQEMVAVYSEEGIHTYKDLCEMAVEWFLRSYLSLRSKAVADNGRKEREDGTEDR